MHRLNRGLARRVGELEKRLKAIPTMLTPEELACADARRLELASAALNDIRPADLLEEEREMFSKALLYAPIFHELIAEDLLGPYLDWQDEEI